MSTAPLPGRALTALVYAILGALVLLPIVLVRVPCLGDYLNHLARIHVLTTVSHSAALQRFYQNHWYIVPYFGMDIPVAVLAQIFGIYDAGRVFIGVCVLMPVLAAAALRYAVHHRIGLVPACGFLLSYNYLLALGFLSYVFSASLAVMLLAGWIAAARWPRWRRAVVFLVPSLALYFCHVFAFVAYGILVGGTELARALRRPRAAWKASAADFAIAGTQAVLPLLLAVSMRAGDTFGSVHVTRYGSMADRIAAFVSPVYFPGAGAVLTAAFVIVLLPGLLLAPRIRLAPQLWPALLAVLLAACAAPAILLNIWGVAFRLPFVAAIVLIGAVSPAAGFGRPASILVLSVLTALVAGRAWTATALLRGLDLQVAQVRQVVAQLPRGARVLVVDGPRDAPRRLAPRALTEHMGTVATIDRDAFVPTLFTGTSPLQVKPALQPTLSPGGGIATISLAQLREGFVQPAPPGALPAYQDGGLEYWLGWPARFDYVLITHFGGDLGNLPKVLRRLAGNDVADLYRIATPDAAR